MTPDWSAKEEPIPYAKLDDPQSLNLYAYVRNNPLSRVDADGHCCEEVMQFADQSGLEPLVIAAGAVTTLAAVWDSRESIVNGIAGAVTAFKSEMGRATDAAAGQDAHPTEPYETGTYGDLKGNSTVGDGLDVHHVPQQQPASQTIGGYDGKTAPAIAIPKGEHKAIPTEKGEATRSPRDQLAKDAKDLRNHTNAPNSQIQKVIDQNKQLYPEMKKPQ
jgi:hypothetical protein